MSKQQLIGVFTYYMYMRHELTRRVGLTTSPPSSNIEISSGISSIKMALKGLKVIEVAGLAPAPFCGLILCDFGANVIRVDRPYPKTKPQQPPLDNLTRGKRSITVDLKKDQGQSIFKRLCTNADVLIEPFRPGVMERLNLGPKQMFELNKKLVYARLSGFGQNGPYAKRAGHDLNYLAMSGVLSILTNNGKPVAPINLLADFAGGGLICAMGILLALIERKKSQLGQIVDVSMVEGARYVASYLWTTRQRDEPASSFIWPKVDKKEANLLDGGAHFYTCYETSDKRWISVACIEPQFYQQLLSVLNLMEDEWPQFDINRWSELKVKLSSIFATKTMDEWRTLFESVDACVEPVLEMSEACENDKNNARHSFLDDGTPRPAPHLSRTPAQSNLVRPKSSSEHTAQVLYEEGYTSEEIANLARDKVIECGLDCKM